jgi:shikimate dehydrogenase
MITFALVGKKLGHSFSKAWFSSKFEREGLHGFNYINIETDELSSLPQTIREQGIRGFNITIPFKQTILPFLDELDPISTAVGAVNTVVVDGEGKLKGFNTDVIGFRETLRPLLKPYHTRALVLGTGGAARAVSYVLDNLFIDYDLATRNQNRTDAIHYDQLTQKDIRNASVIVQTTPLGTYPDVDSSPSIPYSGIEKFHLLYDLVYNPAETQFMREGSRRGAQVVNGMGMLVRQAEESWKLWQAALKTDGTSVR